MKRRDFMMLAGGAAFWSVAARAQQAALPLVAFLSVGSPDAMAGRVAAFRKGLAKPAMPKAMSLSNTTGWEASMNT